MDDGGEAMTLHLCMDGGWVVEPESPIGEQPFDFFYPRGPVLGCSALVCQLCGQRVRNRVEAGARVYECACGPDAVVIARPVREGNDLIPRPAWRCAGHVPLGLPATIDGVTVARGVLAGIVLESLRGDWPPACPVYARPPGLWALRLYHALDDATAGLEIAAAATSAVLDADAHVRRGAIEVVRRIPNAPGVERLVDAARRPELFVGVRTPGIEEDLALGLRIALRRRAEAGDEAAGDALATLDRWARDVSAGLPASYVIPESTTLPPRIYADFNGLIAGVRNPARTAVVLDTFGTVRDLANAGVVLREGLELIVYDESDEDEELEGHGTAHYDPVQRWWVAELDEQGVRYVPTQARAATRAFRCVGCRRDLSAWLRARAGRSADDRCPSCFTRIFASIAPPGDTP